MISRSTLTFRVAALSLAAVVTSAVMLAVPASQAEAAPPPAPVTFDYTGNQTSWVVPANIASLQVEIAAASGVDVVLQHDSALGGTGGTFTVDLGASFAGKTFQVLVGGQGHGSLINQGNSQQAGGGGTYLAVDDSFIAVAGGGGGAGQSFTLADGEFGGMAGGFGGAATGGGNSAFMYSSAAVGQGGQGATPGLPGTSYCGPSCPYQGGTGATASVANGVISSGAGGYGGHTCGGGGGGYAGGGGGSSNFDSTPNADYAGGGGGSGFLVSPLTASSTGTNTGDGFVTFTYTLATPVPTAPIKPVLASTGADLGVVVPVGAILLLLGGLGLALSRRRSVQ